MNIFKQSVWEYSKGQHKTKKKLKIVVPQTKYCTSKQITKTNSTLNKVDCTQIQCFFSARTYFVDGELTVHTLIDDIIDGVSKLSIGSSKYGLSKSNILYFLSSGSKVYLSDIQDYIDCEVRQARNYLKALKLCVLFIDKLYLYGTITPLENPINTVTDNCYSNNFDSTLYNTVTDNCMFDNSDDIPYDLFYVGGNYDPN